MEQVNKVTKQVEMWKSSFGDEYTNRNMLSPAELDDSYKQTYNISRTELNEMFLGNLDRSITILEIGSNIGNQLALLQKMDFCNLCGIELNSYAVELAKTRTKDIDIIQGSVLDIPFKNMQFDLVFTSGSLIHISPSDINVAMQEIHRCAKYYIWGFEYYANEYTEILYRGQKSLLWKSNFSKMYLDQFDDLELVKERRIKYLQNNNVDTMFLLKRLTLNLPGRYK